MKWLWRILIALLVLVVLATGSAALYVRNLITAPFPQTEGTIELTGLEGEVIIKRDEFGIPHIYAQSEADLYFAQGFVHAQDRFWQMEFWRHIGQGRTAEIVGEPGISSDEFIRTVGWHRIGQNTIDFYEETAPEFIAVLEAYSAGVNAYIGQQGGNLSVNYSILQLANEPWEIEPWTPLNTITWGVVMAHDLSGNFDEELLIMELTELLGEEVVAEIWPPYPANRPVIVPTAANGAALPQPAPALAWSNVNTQLVGEAPEFGFAFGRGMGIGSNNWVIAGEHTPSGSPLLADDPHLGIQMPSIWYEVGLHAPGLDVVGFSFAGVPGVIVGHNGHIAWGVTNLGPDVQDLFIEKINPANPNQYEFQGEWWDITTRQEVIQVNGGEPVEITVRETHHGPILSDIEEGLPEDLVLALQWTAFQPSRVLQSVVLLNKAENYDQFHQALGFWDVPGQNFVYADTEGNIAYQSTGLVPIRQTAHDGILPVPGWTGEYEWTGFVPYEEMPTRLNPPEGYIVTANHAVVDDSFPYFMNRSWANGDRGQRITDMIEAELAGDGTVSAEDIGRIQMDSYAYRAASYVPLLAGLSSGDAEVQAALDQFVGWDYQLRRESVPAALFEIWMMHLLPAIVADELGEEAADLYVSNGDVQSIFLHTLATQPNGAWWDDVTTADKKETSNDIILLTLRQTVDWFKENQGGEMGDWTWGSIHTATFMSNPLGQSGIGPLESLVNRGPFASDGGSAIVNAQGWRWSNPAEVRGHPSLRLIVDFADFEQSVAVNPTGQSGHPNHPHYDDMIELWLNGQFHPIYFGEAAVDAATVDTLTLRPR
ncbi:MAG: penicillin acylase family protein [Chloroflexi bacterium]|nr:penicillin acylase family protein [Chloroflexota bacterium]